MFIARPEPLQLPPHVRADRDDLVAERRILADWPPLRRLPSARLPRLGDTIRVRTAANQHGTAELVGIDHGLGQVTLVLRHWDGLAAVAAGRF